MTTPYQTHDRTSGELRLERSEFCLRTAALVVLVMSHLAYPNLARVENFTERRLNYTGITLEGWSDGPNLWVHLGFLVLSLAVGGLPRRGRRIEGLWCLLNIIIIHPMD
ncbi:MAG: hypothetical protein MJE68_31310 [Proteobacteria bacterium]|nr:hypothetical protein [Pseudomonadota bacterium]